MDGTMAWWRDYEDFLQAQIKVNNQIFMDFSEFYEHEEPTTESSVFDDDDGNGLDLSNLATFVKLPQYAHWNDSIKWRMSSG
jgi:hypothetical protein